MRLPMLAGQVNGALCLLQTHCAFLLEDGDTPSGISYSFPGWCHSAASSGCKAAKDLHLHGCLPEQKGQVNLFSALSMTLVCHS